MKIMILSLILSQVLLQPLARKWELPLGPVITGSLLAGAAAGTAANIILSVAPLGLFAQIALCGFLVITIAAGMLLLRFYRDPERVSPDDDNVLLSPADGTIKYIKRIEPGNIPLSCKGRENAALNPAFVDMLPDQKGYLVGIAMNFLDVHVTRAPVPGKVVFTEHSEGGFASLKKPEALYKNERYHHIIRTDRFSIGLIHIASRLVRRIVSYVGEGDTVCLGQRLGIIKFGSQVDLLLPEEAAFSITVKPGDKVTAGVTPIATRGYDPVNAAVPGAAREQVA